MASDRNEQTGISRRDFGTRLGAATAGVVVGGDWLGAAPRGRPHHRRQRSRGARQHRHPRPGQLAQARLRAADERRDQDAVRHRRQPRARAHQRRAAEGRRRRSSRASCRTCAACSTTRTSTPSSSRRRITGTRSRPSGGCRPASTCSSRSRRRTRCWEGRQMIEAAARYKKIVQVGTMNRSRPAGAARRSSSSTTAASARSTWRAACASSRGRRSASIPTARWRPARSTR